MTPATVTLAPETIDALAEAIARTMRPPVERLVYTPDEAAEALGFSRDHFDLHVKRQLRLVRAGQLVRIPRVELERYVAENAVRVLDE